MAVGSYGSHNKPVFNNVSTTQADLQAGVDYAEKVGHAKSGTTAEMNALSGSDVWDGLLFGNTSDGVTYQRKGGAWKPNSFNLGATLGSGLSGGSPPTSTSPILVQMGVAAVGLNANGDGSINYSTAFPNGVMSCFLQRYDYSVYGSTGFVLAATQGKTAMTFRVFQTNGSPLPSTTIYVSWQAWGW